MSVDTQAVIQDTVSSLYLAEQIDLLHLAVATLSDAVDAGETDLFLEQPGKSAQQKKLYLEKLAAEVRSPELRAALNFARKAEDSGFFLRKNLVEFLTDLDHAVEKILIVRLTVAIEFKPADIRELAETLSKRLGRPAAFDITVDSSLIGGAVIQLGSYISDYSLKSRLTRFREEWKAAVVEKAH